MDVLREFYASIRPRQSPVHTSVHTDAGSRDLRCEDAGTFCAAATPFLSSMRLPLLLALFVRRWYFRSAPCGSRLRRGCRHARHECFLQGRALRLRDVVSFCPFCLGLCAVPGLRRHWPSLPPLCGLAALLVDALRLALAPCAPGRPPCDRCDALRLALAPCARVRPPCDRGLAAAGALHLCALLAALRLSTFTKCGMTQGHNLTGATRQGTPAAA